MADEMRITHAGGGRSATQRASGLCGPQFGVIARRQLLAVGFSSRRIDCWLHSGRLHRRYPGVYAWGRPELPEQGELAASLLYAGRGAALGGLSGLWWRGLLGRRPNLIWVDAPGRRGSRQDVLIRHPRRLEREWHRGLPVTSLPRALLSASEPLSHNSLRLVLARAEYERFLSLRALSAALAGGPRGSTAIRRAMEVHLPQLARCANRLEREFVLLCERFRLPLPEPNERIGRYRPDMHWRKQRLTVELDGDRAHSTPAQLASDAARQDELERRGYTVIRFSWEEVELRPGWVAERVRAALGRGV